MLTVPTYLAESAIDGIGLFAAEAIAAGTVIWTRQYDRAFLPAEIDEMPAHARRFFEQYGYELIAHPGVWFCALDNSRFMNHDPDTPTTTVQGEVFVAARDIAAGEELTYDYDSL